MKEFEIDKNIFDLNNFSDENFLNQIDVIMQEKKQILLLECHN
jgi:hypothetical protein